MHDAQPIERHASAEANREDLVKKYVVGNSGEEDLRVSINMIGCQRRFAGCKANTGR